MVCSKTQANPITHLASQLRPTDTRPAHALLPPTDSPVSRQGSNNDGVKHSVRGPGQFAPQRDNRDLLRFEPEATRPPTDGQPRPLKDNFDKMNDQERDALRAKIASHKPSRASQVGEQRKLNFDLPADTKDFRFGKSSQSSEFKVGDCLNHRFDDSGFRGRDEEFRATRDRERWADKGPVGGGSARQGLLQAQD